MSKCILFDCDGTLVDSEWICNLGLAIKFGELGIELDPHDLIVRYRGWKLTRTLDALSREYDVRLSEDFIPGYRQVVSELFESDLKPVEGIESALQALDQPRAVVSSGPPHKIQQALRVCGLTEYFGDNIYSCYDVGIWKPDPGIYRHAATDMGFAPGDCVVVDDSPVGVEAGAKAEMRTFFYNKFDEQCQFSGVCSFTSMFDLPHLIRASASAPKP